MLRLGIELQMEYWLNWFSASFDAIMYNFMVCNTS